MIMKTQPESSAPLSNEQGILRAQTEFWSASNFRQLGISSLGPFGLFMGLSGLWTSPCFNLIWLSCASSKIFSSELAAAQRIGLWTKSWMFVDRCNTLIFNGLNNRSNEQKTFRDHLLFLTQFLNFTPCRLVLGPLGNTRFHTNTRRHADFG
jgi:hypothetical protein